MFDIINNVFGSASVFVGLSNSTTFSYYQLNLGILNAFSFLYSSFLLLYYTLV